MPETPVNNASGSSENTYLWLWALLIVLCSAFFYTKAKNKMQEIAGESLKINVSDDKRSKGGHRKIEKI